MAKGNVARLIALAAMSPIGGFAAFVLYVWVRTGEPQVAVSSILWMFGYPVAAVSVVIIGVPLLLLRSRLRLNTWEFLALVLVSGAIGGGLIYVLLFGPGVLGPAHWNPTLAFEYSFMGLGVALAAWLISSFGPLRLNDLEPRRRIPAA